ncbi:putative oxidoreductase YteT isoform X2 [Ptychodera flava]|uniref:putative oxidoreductase YteT isoform X2 n=1 Tax=Ptychodera flava TaxID=63121 RepID=UPI00396A9229
MKQVKAVIIGAGSRGSGYALFQLDFPHRFKVVGVADPIKIRVKKIQEKYSIPDEHTFSDWSEFVKCDKFADAVIVTTPDILHKGPAVACADKGYHILLEKPMAVTEEDCRQIAQACERNNVMLAVCHVLRYHPPLMKVKELIESDVIGDVVNIQHTEPIGYWHFAHSFVRGNWREEKSSTFSLLAKSCHDLDLLRYWMGKHRCTQVSSFGSLQHFKKENKPVGAGSRCLDCSVEANCPYSAKKIYLDKVEMYREWPINVISEIPDVESVTEALRSGPYGRCVYECDNDVCDNQVVNFTFEEGRTASFTMIAFTEKVCQRQTKVYGTRGEITSEGKGPVYVYDFNTNKTTRHDTATPPSGTHLGGHGGADHFLMDAFVRAVSTNDASHISTGPQDALASHLLVFAAEKARRENRIITINEDYTYQ